MNIEASAIIARLVSEYGYSEQGAQIALQNLSTSHPAVQKAFEKWWRGEGLDDQLQVRGYTLKKLVEQQRYSPIRALVMMADMLREPKSAVPNTTMNIEASAIIARLVSEYGYSEHEARMAVQDLSTSHPAVQKAFEKWWRGEGLDEQLQVRGYTAKRLVERRGLNPVSALLTMDGLLSEPELMVEALRRGHDVVLVSEETRARYTQQQESASEEEVTEAEQTRAETEAAMAIVETWIRVGMIQPMQAAVVLTTLEAIRKRLIEDPGFEDATPLIERLPEQERKILEEAYSEGRFEADYFLQRRKKE